MTGMVDPHMPLLAEIRAVRARLGTYDAGDWRALRCPPQPLLHLNVSSYEYVSDGPSGALACRGSVSIGALNFSRTSSRSGTFFVFQLMPEGKFLIGNYFVTQLAEYSTALGHPFHEPRDPCRTPRQAPISDGQAPHRGSYEPPRLNLCRHRGCYESPRVCRRPST